MARIRHLSRAPIAEAVIELRVRPSSDTTLQSLEPLSERLRASFPVVQRIESIAAKFGLKDGKPLPTDTTYEQLGILLKTADQQDVVQIRTDGFAVSRLPPYTSWEKVLPRALELWTQYCDVARPERVNRLGVRYVNRLRLPMPVDLSAHLTSPPTIPEMLPQVLRGYLTRMVLHDPETGNSVTVTQATEPSTDSEHLIVLLDIDALREVDLDPSSQEVGSMLESLRQQKNRAFFGSVTEQTAERYQ